MISYNGSKALLFLLVFVPLFSFRCKKHDALSSEKDIVSFEFYNFTPPVKGTIDVNGKTIKLKIRPAVDPSSLTPTITIPPNATISPKSGIAQNFTNPVQYIVTAQDGSTVSYTASLIKPDASVKDVPTGPKTLCIFYGYPSLINNSNGNIVNAVNEFKNFDIIVLGDGLWKTSHSDNVNTKNIIGALKVAKPAIKIFGYIDVGVTTQNLTETDLKLAIDGWKLMGVTGIFGDDFGFDFNVTRLRQNVLVDYAHSKSLSVFANSWNVEDALGGSDSHLDSTYNDYFLLESFLVGAGSFRSLDEFKLKGDLAYYYMKTKKIGIACSATILTPQISQTSNTTNYFQQSWHGAAMYNFDAYQFTDSYHSASTSRVYLFPNPISSYGTSWVQYDWIKRVSATRYERSTNTNTFYIDGNGSTIGSGGH